MSPYSFFDYLLGWDTSKAHGFYPRRCITLSPYFIPWSKVDIVTALLRVCLKVHVPRYHGWDTKHSPEVLLFSNDKPILDVYTAVSSFMIITITRHENGLAKAEETSINEKK